MRHIRRSLLSILSILFFCALAAGPSARAGEDASAVDIFPETTLVALLIPDLAQARAAAGKTPLAAMFAEPEMQEFLRPALDEMKRQYEQLRAANPLIPALEDLDAGIFSGEIAIAIYTRPKGEAIRLGVAVLLRPKDAEAFKRLAPLPLRQKLVDGYMEPMGPREDHPAVAFSGGRLLFCAPHGDMQGLLARLKDPAARKQGTLAASKPFAAPRAKFANSAAWLYLSSKSSPDALSDILQASAGARGNAGLGGMSAAVTLSSALDVLGLENMTALAMGLTFTEGGATVQSFLGLDGPVHDGFLSIIIPEKSTTADALKIAPMDAPFVSVATFHFGRIIPSIEKALQIFAPREAGQVAQTLPQLTKMVGFDIQKDLLENLGGSVVVAQTVHDTSAPMSFMPGMVISVEAKNPAKVTECLNKLATLLDNANGAMAQKQGVPIGLGVKVKRLKHRGKDIIYLGGMVFAGPGALAVVGDRLLLGTSLNALRRGIEQLEAPDSILGNKAFQETLARITGAPFNPNALPLGFAFSLDQGGGTGTLLATGVGLASGAVALAGLAEIPSPNGRLASNPQGIQANERAAGAACKAYADAQDIYRRTDWNKDGVLEYAQAIGGDFSLYETTAGAADISLVDRAMAQAEGNPGANVSRNGYRFKILKGQGKGAGVERSYVVANNRMTIGYALVAYPAQYGVSGKQTFQISNAGTVYAKDLGEQTATEVAAMTMFLESEGWTPADEDAPRVRRSNNPFEEIMAKPAGKALIEVAGAIDMGLWPDEAFFIKHRRPSGAVTTMDATGLFATSDLPAPGPVHSLSASPVVIVAGAAVVAALAVPNLVRSRMVANETAAVASCKSYAFAQDIYRRTDYDKDGALEYAQSLGGKPHSLYFAGEEAIQIIDKAFANAEGEPGQATPKAGYYFKVLKGQGPAAGKQRSYMNGENMTTGYALLAYPATYDGTGRNSFMINNTGTIYQADLGPQTHAIAQEMTEFNPDPNQGWIATE